MRGFEDGVAGDVIDVAAGRDADAADLRRERVAEIIAVEVERGDDVEILGRVSTCCSVMSAMASLMTMPCGSLAPRAAVDFHRAELALGQLVAPIAERAFGVLHDVALVDNRHALALLPMAYSMAARTRRSVPGLLTGLMPMPIWSAASLPKRIFLNSAGSSRCMNSRIFFASGLPAW